MSPKFIAVAIALIPALAAARETVLLKDGEYVAVPYEVFAKSSVAMHRYKILRSLEHSAPARVKNSSTPLSIRFSKDPSNDRKDD